MAVSGLRRGDISIHGIGSEEGFAVRWHRLLFQAASMPGFHLGPLTLAPLNAAPDGHSEPQLPGVLNETTTIPADDPAGAVQEPRLGAPAPDPAPQLADLVGLLGDGQPDPLWHPPYVLSGPLDQEPDPTATPADDPSDSLIPKADAVLWHGPALMIFPGEPQDTADAAAAPDTSAGTNAPDTAGSGVPDTADAAPPDTAGTPDAVTRADFDPVLTAMGSGAAHPAPSDSGGADLTSAFLPPDADDPLHGIDSGMLLTPPPIPPPPETI